MITEILAGASPELRAQVFKEWRDAGVIPEDVQYRQKGSNEWHASLQYAYGYAPDESAMYRIVPDAQSNYSAYVAFDPPNKEDIDVFAELLSEAKENDLLDDEIHHPKHYTSHPSGVECKTIIMHYPCFHGAAMKYLWRTGLKGDDAIKDLRKAIQCIEFEIERLEMTNVESKRDTSA